MKKIREWFEWHSVKAHVEAAVWLRVPEKARWRIVGWLNDNRWTRGWFCWADLVSAALTRPEQDLCDVHTVSGAMERKPRCASVCDWMHPDDTGEHLCACYCGKFRFTAAEGALDRRAATAAHEPGVETAAPVAAEEGR